MPIDTREDSGYGIIWGPAPGNAADCHLTSSCDCIRDTDSADGIGRWPGRHGIERDGGDYGSNFVNFMYKWYRNYADAAVDDGPEPGLTGGLPDLPNPVSYLELTARYPRARIYDLTGRKTGTMMPAAGLYLVEPTGAGMLHPVMIVE